MRPISACSPCRSRKRRCIAVAAGAPCELCTLKKWQCDLIISPYAAQGNDISKTGVCGLRNDPAPRPNLVAGIIPTEVCNELVDMYFVLVHDKQHIIFHAHSFINNQRQGCAANFLVLGIVALMARFSSHPFFDNIPPWHRGRLWLQRAVQEFNRRPKLIDIESLQGCLLLAFVSLVEMDADQDTLLSAQAVRMVQVLQLPTLLSPEPIRREVEIRLFWQCWMMETWHSVQAQFPAQLKVGAHFKPPLDEGIFSAMRATDPPDLLTEDRIVQMGLRERSIWGMILPLTEIHGQVVRLNDELARQSLAHGEIRHRVTVLATRLDHWLQTLPDSLRDTPENWRAQAERGSHREFAAMHMLYHHQSQLLYYQFLHWAVSSILPSTPTDPNSLHYSNKCKAHATALGQIMWNLHSSQDPALGTETQCLWSPLNGHLLVVASSVHLHSMLFDTHLVAIENSRLMLEHNFIMLLQLQKYWPSLQLSLSRLRAFHRACLMEQSERQFDMDSWMISFLNRYMSSIPDRHEELMSGNADNVNGFCASRPIVGSPAAGELWRELFGEE
ncbi:hypothetical protein BJX65DRAFT_264740 [Aspergillus insuetus]